MVANHISKRCFLDINHNIKILHFSILSHYIMTINTFTAISTALLDHITQLYIIKSQIENIQNFKNIFSNI